MTNKTPGLASTFPRRGSTGSKNFVGGAKNYTPIRTRRSSVSTADITTSIDSAEVAEWDMSADGARDSSMPSLMTKAASSSSDKSPIRPSSPSSMDTDVTQVSIECNAEDDKTKSVPIYKAGMDVHYKGPNNMVTSARILNVHLDDMLEPYYDIQFEDGREKQTDNAHLMVEHLMLEP
mmetsp:Transcript_25604/g.55079  ORF Transcript_25604/g.55079 Transcript_25604/m.55079 type:complete len:178 (-) Transcript_25604:457-990(-)